MGVCVYIYMYYAAVCGRVCLCAELCAGWLKVANLTESEATHYKTAPSLQALILELSSSFSLP